MPRSRRIALFLGLTYAASWSLALTMSLLGIEGGSPEWRALGILYMFPPLLAALIVQGPVLKEPVVAPLGLRISMNRWFLVASFAPVAVAWIAIGLTWLTPGLEVAMTTEQYIEMNRHMVEPEQLEEFTRQMRQTPIHPALRMTLQAVVAGLTFSLIVSMGEEVGWRGFLYKEVQGGFWYRAWLIGLAWGLFLLPLVAQGHLYPQHPGVGVVMVFLWTLLTTPLIHYVRERTGSCVSAAIFRGTTMSLTHVPGSVTSGGTDLTSGLYGATGLAAAALVLLALWAYDRRLGVARVMV